MAHSHLWLHVHKIFNPHIGKTALRYFAIHFRISGNDSVVPTGLIFLSLDIPGTEVPGYSHRVPNGTQHEFGLSITVDLTNPVLLQTLLYVLRKARRSSPLAFSPDEH